MNPFKHDTRYTVALEYTGKPNRQFVARFCGERIGASDVQDVACNMAVTHLAAMLDRMGLAQPAELHTA